MAIKGISYSEVKAKALKNPEVRAAYEEALREEKLESLLRGMREKAGINSSEVARRMGVSQSAVSRIEHNPVSIKLSTLERYASACGARISITTDMA